MRTPWSSIKEKIIKEKRAVRVNNNIKKHAGNAIVLLIEWAKGQSAKLEKIAVNYGPDLSNIYYARKEWIDFELMPKLETMLLNGYVGDDSNLPTEHKVAIQGLRKIYSRVYELSRMSRNVCGELYTLINKRLYGTRGNPGYADSRGLTGSIIYWITQVDDDLGYIDGTLKEHPDIWKTFDTEIGERGKLFGLYKEAHSIRTAIDDIRMSLINAGAYNNMPLFGLPCMSNEHSEKIDVTRELLTVTIKDLESIQDRIFSGENDECHSQDGLKNNNMKGGTV